MLFQQMLTYIEWWISQILTPAYTKLLSFGNEAQGILLRVIS